MSARCTLHAARCRRLTHAVTLGHRGAAGVASAALEQAFAASESMPINPLRFFVFPQRKQVRPPCSLRPSARASARLMAACAAPRQVSKLKPYTNMIAAGAGRLAMFRQRKSRVEVLTPSCCVFNESSSAFMVGTDCDITVFSARTGDVVRVFSCAGASEVLALALDYRQRRVVVGTQVRPCVLACCRVPLRPCSRAALRAGGHRHHSQLREWRRHEGVCVRVCARSSVRARADDGAQEFTAHSSNVVGLHYCDNRKVSRAAAPRTRAVSRSLRVQCFVSVSQDGSFYIHDDRNSVDGSAPMRGVEGAHRCVTHARMHACTRAPILPADARAAGTRASQHLRCVIACRWSQREARTAACTCGTLKPQRSWRSCVVRDEPTTRWALPPNLTSTPAMRAGLATEVTVLKFLNPFPLLLAGDSSGWVCLFSLRPRPFELLHKFLYASPQASEKGAPCCARTAHRHL